MLCHILQLASGIYGNLLTGYALLLFVIDILRMKYNLFSRELVTNNAGSRLDERAYLLLIHTTSNYT
jgi:hypothetical protein